MKALSVVEGVVLPLDRADVDTDQIVPKQFLKRVERTGYGRFAFHDWRYRADGTPDPDFVLNRPEYEGAKILVTGRNFGCGSSREHAPWALQDLGLDAVIAPSFADIFRSNCHQIGLLPLELPEAAVAALLRRALERPGFRARVDLHRQVVEAEEGFRETFAIEAFPKRCLLEGLDPIGLTLEHEAAIESYERRAGIPG